MVTGEEVKQAVQAAGITSIPHHDCGLCGEWHAIPEAMHEACLSEGGYWTCPNGHSRGYSEGSLQSRLEKEIKRREWAEANVTVLSPFTTFGPSKFLRKHSHSGSKVGNRNN